MKVLVFTHLFPNTKSPTLGVFIKERMLHFSKINGCEIKVVAPVPYFPPININKRWFYFSQIPKKEMVQGVEVYHPRYFQTPKVGMSFYGLSMYPSALKKAKQIRKQFDFDLIDAHWVYPDSFAAVLLSRFFKKPLIVSARGGDINLYSKDFLIKKLIVYTLNNAKRVIAVSNALKSAMVDLGITESKIIVIPNGVDIKKFHAVEKEKSRRFLNIPLDKKIILTVASLRKIKGLSLLIEAISEIIHEVKKSDVMLLIIGEGEERKSIARQIARLKLKGHVKLLGAKAHETLFQWYSAADIFCLPSSTEGWPNVIFESLACGTPVVASSVGGVPEIIISDDYGTLVKERTGKAFASAIIKALDRKWDPDKMIEYAKRNTWVQVAQNVKDLFETVLKTEGS
jgi:glycosyltransferase involved in cell wall biosynthesis